jgi:hypothetical protein
MIISRQALAVSMLIVAQAVLSIYQAASEVSVTSRATKSSHSSALWSMVSPALIATYFSLIRWAVLPPLLSAIPAGRPLMSGSLPEYRRSSLTRMQTGLAASWSSAWRPAWPASAFLCRAMAPGSVSFG